LQDEFEIPQTDEIREPDVLLVNADNPHALLRWKIASGSNKRLVSVMLSSKGVQIENTIALKRPLTLNKLVSVFKTISSTERQVMPVPRGRGRISQVSPFNLLVVDDSLPVRKYLEYKIPQLTSLPLEIDYAANGVDAMNKVQRKPYHVIFLDVVMPGVDGYKVCKWIKANANSRVVLLTSKRSPFDKVRGAMSGCDNYLVKPPKDESVRKILSNLLKF